MNLIVKVFSIIFWVILASALQPNELYFNQNLIHSSGITWCCQRYFVNTEHFREGTPLYAFLVAGELNSETVNDIFVDSLIADLIEERGGGLFAVETRFYGESRPVISHSIENLATLTIDNILMDFNRILIDEFLIPTPFEFPIIVVGEGLGATYATFFHVTYSLSSSVVAFGALTRAQTDFGEYLIDIDSSFMTHGQNEHLECREIIGYGLGELINYFSIQNASAIEHIFKLEPNSFDVSNPKDRTLLFEDFLSNYIGAALALHDTSNLINFCTPIVSATGSDLERLVVGFTPSRAYNYDQFVDSLRNEDILHLNDMPHNPMSSRQRFYQQCSQLNWFRTTTELSEPTGSIVPVEFYYELCADVFGSQFTPEFIVNNHNFSIAFHGNRIMESGTNSIFVYGELDPYRLVGVTEAPASSDIYNFTNYGNTRGLRSASAYDSSDIQLIKRVLLLHFLSFYS